MAERHQDIASGERRRVCGASWFAMAIDQGASLTFDVSLVVPERADDHTRH